jgi:hypothetical protein
MWPISVEYGNMDNSFDHCELFVLARHFAEKSRSSAIGFRRRDQSRATDAFGVNQGQMDCHIEICAARRSVSEGKFIVGERIRYR